MIVIDQNYSLKNDGFRGCTLIFQEERERRKLDKDKKETGETYKFIFKDSWYYPRMSDCLEEYLKQTGSKVNSIQECIDLLKEKNTILEQVKIMFSERSNEFFNSKED